MTIGARHGPVSLVVNMATSVAAATCGRSERLGQGHWRQPKGVHAFVPAMVAGDRPGLAIDIRSKQGVTKPSDNRRQCQQGRGEGAHRGAGAYTARRNRRSRNGASAYSRFYSYQQDSAYEHGTAGAWSAITVIRQRRTSQARRNMGCAYQMTRCLSFRERVRGIVVEDWPEAISMNMWPMATAGQLRGEIGASQMSGWFWTTAELV